MNTLFKSFLAFMVALPLFAPPVFAGTFTETQESEIKELVKGYLKSNPEVVIDALVAWEERQQAEQEQAAKGILSDLDFSNDPKIGAKDGIIMVEFFDYQCGYCKRSFKDILKLLETEKDVTVVLKEFPILGNGSRLAAKAALASRKQNKYDEMHSSLIQSRGRITEKSIFRTAESLGLDIDQLKRDMNDPEIDAIIAKNAEIAEKLGINGTPAFIIGDEIFPGAISLQSMKSQLARVRKGKS